MFSSQQGVSSGFAAFGNGAATSSSTNTTATTLSYGNLDSAQNIEPLFGEVYDPGPSGESPYSYPDHLLSDSSAEDDMTLGPDPDSADPHPASHLHALEASHHMTLSQLQPAQLHPHQTHPHSLQVTTPMSGIMANSPSPSSHLSHFSPPKTLPSAAYDTQTYARPKRNSSAMDSEILNTFGRHTSPSRKRSKHAEDSTPHSTTPSSSSSAGYYYRSRDKTNYNQAHKGTLPSPPSTPDSSKRIRCTWNLEETRVLYDLLRDTDIENFPDAQFIRQHLLRLDPTCNKTLDHVRNKKANLIQKAHSKNVSVAEILIHDMNKLEQEVPAAARNAMTLSSSSLSGGISGASSAGLESSSASSRGGGGASGGSGGGSASSHASSHGSHHRHQVAKTLATRPSRRRTTKRAPTSVVTGSPAQTATAQQLAKVGAARQQEKAAAAAAAAAASAAATSSATAGSSGAISAGHGGTMMTSTPSANSSQPHTPSTTVSHGSAGTPGDDLQATGGSELPTTNSSTSPSESPAVSSSSPTPSGMSSSTASSAPGNMLSGPSMFTTTIPGQQQQQQQLQQPQQMAQHQYNHLHHTGTASISEHSSSSSTTSPGHNNLTITIPASATSMFTSTMHPAIYQPIQLSPAVWNAPPQTLAEFDHWKRWVLNEVAHLTASQNEVRAQLRLQPLEMAPTPASASYVPPRSHMAPQPWDQWNVQDSVDSSEEPESSEDHANGALVMDPQAAGLSNVDSSPMNTQW